MKRYNFLLTSLMLSTLISAQAQEAVTADNVASDVACDTTVKAPKKRNIIQKVVDYISNKDDNELDTKKVSWSFIGGPFYSSEEKFSVAITGTCNYRLNGCDLEMQKSFASAYGKISTAGFWEVGIYGTTFFPGDKQRINYDTQFGYSPRHYYGIGYEAGRDNDYINLQQKEAKIKAEYVVSLFPNFYLGPSMQWNYNTCSKDVELWMLDDKDRTVHNLGVGAVLQYDTRDLITNASRGVYGSLGALFFPKFMWNKYAFTKVEYDACYYHTAWRDAIIAGQFRGTFNFGNPSWAMMALYGGNETMRGYYLGQFRDKHMMAAQVEIRQHVWRRNGIVVWGGIGQVFHDSKSFGKNWLPNYGVGYRWEFRNRMNVRLDMGFGRHGSSGIIFSMNEAF